MVKDTVETDQLTHLACLRRPTFEVAKSPDAKQDKSKETPAGKIDSEITKQQTAKESQKSTKLTSTGHHPRHGRGRGSTIIPCERSC